ncbi:TPA: DUF1198 family protein [Vibrio parahaemolyticus]|uniref:DUF1198 family protein n=1 Tax=Vibrio alginolyticus TaxID=663 RepID=UPI003D7D9D53|nr:DUF1198 family protein [Vibrio parahaemolyticus]HCH2083796.1 DUF1198 family protein [Vibrio parahaemolyticus]
MIWAFVAVIVIYLIYRFSSGDIRKASKIIAYSLNVKHPLVTECIGAMRTDSNPAMGKATRQQAYCQSVVRAHGNVEQLSSFIKVFYIYQVLKNPHEENIRWWANRLKDAGYDPQITASDRQSFEVFFDVDYLSFKEFVVSHNEILI